MSIGAMAVEENSALSVKILLCSANAPVTTSYSQRNGPSKYSASGCTAVQPGKLRLKSSSNNTAAPASRLARKHAATQNHLLTHRASGGRFVVGWGNESGAVLRGAEGCERSAALR